MNARLESFLSLQQILQKLKDRKRAALEAQRSSNLNIEVQAPATESASLVKLPFKPTSAQSVDEIGESTVQTAASLETTESSTLVKLPFRPVAPSKRDDIVVVQPSAAPIKVPNLFPSVSALSVKNPQISVDHNYVTNVPVSTQVVQTLSSQTILAQSNEVPSGTLEVVPGVLSSMIALDKDDDDSSKFFAPTDSIAIQNTPIQLVPASTKFTIQDTASSGASEQLPVTEVTSVVGSVTMIVRVEQNVEVRSGSKAVLRTVQSELQTVHFTAPEGSTVSESPQKTDVTSPVLSSAESSSDLLLYSQNVLLESTPEAVPSESTVEIITAAQYSEEETSTKTQQRLGIFKTLNYIYYVKKYLHS